MENYMMGDTIRPWKGGIAQSITFVITQDCNLRCKYCYMTNKNTDNVMSVDVGKRAIDYFLTNDTRFVSDAVVLEFIGGEPLLEIDLIDELTDYFKLRAYELNHKWFTMFRVSISSNGLLYSSDKVQKYLKKNYGKVSIGITIDGTREKNDLQRVYPNGQGSYDDVIKNVNLWKKQFPGATTKVTIGHDDLPYLKESIIHLWNLGLYEIPANVVFEDVWENGDDELFYSQLLELADYIIDNNLWLDHNTSLFTQGIGYPLTKEELNKNSCGTGSMIAIDAKGNFYPCIRFMDYSLNNHPGYITGNIYDGIDSDKIRPFYYMTVENQSDDECINCDIASGCQWCTGYNYDCSAEGTIFKRNKAICKMHKARVRANNYLWARLVREKNLQLKRTRTRNKYLFVILSNNSVPICNYENNNDDIAISKAKLRDIATYCEKNFITPVLVHSDNSSSSKDICDIFRGVEYINIYSSNNIATYSRRDIIYFSLEQIMKNTQCFSSCILKVNLSQLSLLSESVIYALNYFERINIQIDYTLNDAQLIEYKKQLLAIANALIEYYKNGLFKQINVITDDVLNSHRTNCNFGYTNFAIAPNEKVYSCPAMYYMGKNEETTILEEIPFNKKPFDINSNPVCKDCEMKHCRWCVVHNKLKTNEYNSPASIQCKISLIERNASDVFYRKLKAANMEKYATTYKINISQDDPITKRSTDLFNFSCIN